MIAITFISLKVCLIDFIGISSLSSRIFMEGICIVALALVVITIRGSISDWLIIRLSINP